MMSKPYSKGKFLKEVAEELHDVRRKWRLIGTQLEVPQSTLKAIEQKHKDELELALMETINEWLNQIVVDGDPSWSDIIDALQSRSVGEPALASNLRRRKCRDSMAPGMCNVTFLKSDVTLTYSFPHLSVTDDTMEGDAFQPTGQEMARSKLFLPLVVTNVYLCVIFRLQCS